MPAIRQAKDTSLKLVLNEPELFVEFLRDFVPIEILKDIDPKDVEDVTERLLPLMSEQKDLDTVKRVNLKGGTPLFVITVVDHESTVNYRAPFKMLLYTAFILDDYEKEANKHEAEKRKALGQDYKGRITQTKGFKYPPILPIVFYDGEDEWTAETNFLHRTAMNDIFEKYIPKFEYELVSLKEYSFEDLAKFGDVISMFMIIDKLKTAEAFSELGKLRESYGEQINSMNIPTHLKTLLVQMCILLLQKIDVPQDKIDAFVERIDERGMSEMLAIENYNVQETRRQERELVMKEAERHVAEERRRVAAERRRANKSEQLFKSAVKLLLAQGNTLSEVAAQMGISEQEITNMLPEFG